MNPAIVLSCDGCCIAALGVVRALGRHGVPVIVISESARTIAALSRYCIAHFVAAAPFGRDPSSLRTLLLDIGERYRCIVPVFPCGDPDLNALILIQETIGPYARSTLCTSALAGQLIDKFSFIELARTHDLPVPRTHAPKSQSELTEVAQCADFPVVIKPAFPFNWSPGLRRIFAGKKAVVVTDAQALTGLVGGLGHTFDGLLVQDYVVGDDAEHYDVHVYVGDSASESASFTGRKWRIYPIHAGSGSYVESVMQPELEASTIDMLMRIGFRGIANVNYKRDCRSGDFRLLEINSRVSQWSTFTTRMGVNLPWLAYCEHCAIDPGKRAERQFGRFFVDGKIDFKAFRQYRAAGEMNCWTYLRSLLRRGLVFQVFDWVDRAPWISQIREDISALVGSVIRRAARAPQR